MNITRRRLLAATAGLPVAGPMLPFSMSFAAMPNAATSETAATDKLLLTDFTGERPYYMDGVRWRGFSDQVMGGISEAAFGQDTIGGKTVARMTGNVTRESNGGFIQLSLSFGRWNSEFDASAYSGIEMLVYGNNEDYNLHVRTSDCGWYEQSYRMTFFAKPEWQTVRVPWSAFEPNGLRAPLDTGALNRIAILGWMREFRADISLAQMSLYA